METYCCPADALNVFASDLMPSNEFESIPPIIPFTCDKSGVIPSINGPIAFIESANCNCCCINVCVSFVNDLMPSLPINSFN